MLEGLFDNKMIQELAFGKLKNAIKASGKAGYLITLDANDEIVIAEIGKDVVLITEADLEFYKAAALKELQNGS